MAQVRGRVVAFNAGPVTATIRVDGSAGETLQNVAVSRAIAAADMTSPRRVVLDTGDHNNPADFVITAVWP